MLTDFDDNCNSLADKEAILRQTARLTLELCDSLSKLQQALYNIEICFELYEKYPIDSPELGQRTCYFVEQFFSSFPCDPSVLTEKCNLIHEGLKLLSNRKGE